MSAAHAHPPYAHRRSLNAHRWSKAQAGRAYLRLVVLSVGKRVVAQHGRLGDAPAVRCDSGRAASPKPCHDVRRRLRTKRCARCDTAWATPVATAPRRRAGAAALAAPEDGRALVARAACTELAARRSAAAAPGSWRLDVGPLSLCSSWSGWSGDPPAPAASRERLGAACPRPGRAPALPPPPQGQRRGRRWPSSAPFMASREPESYRRHEDIVSAY